jgi:hypothetical protein
MAGFATRRYLKIDMDNCVEGVRRDTLPLPIPTVSSVLTALTTRTTG